MKNKYEKECGIELIYISLEVEKESKKLKKTVHKMKVLLSNEKSYVVENNYGTLQIIEKKHSKYSSDRAVNQCKPYKREWGIRSLPDCIEASMVSTFSEKVALNRVKKKLFDFIRKETYFYDGLIESIENQLNSLK